MADLEDFEKNALGRSQILKAKAILAPLLSDLIQDKLPKQHDALDFTESIDVILKNWDTIFPNGSMFDKSLFESVKWIQDSVSRQDFEDHQFERKMECLANVASFTQRPDLKKEIFKLLEEVTSRVSHENVGNVENMIGKFHEMTREEVEDAIRRNPQDLGYYALLYTILLQLGKYEEAIRVCEDGLQHDPDDEYLLICLGGAIYLLGVSYWKGEKGYPVDLKMAENLLKKASQLDHCDAEYILGCLYLDSRRNAEAVVSFTKATETSTQAEWELGYLQAFGHGCPRDEKSARHWLTISHKYVFKTEKDVEDVIKSSAEVVAFEAKNGLDVEGLTIKERLERYQNSKAK